MTAVLKLLNRWPAGSMHIRSCESLGVATNDEDMIPPLFLQSSRRTLCSDSLPSVAMLPTVVVNTPSTRAVRHGHTGHRPTTSMYVRSSRDANKTRQRDQHVVMTVAAVR